MKKQISLGLAFSLIALTASVTFILTLSFSRTVFHKELSELEQMADKYDRLKELDQTVQREFYTDVPEDDVIDGMLAGYISGLGDQYSVYRSEKELTAYHDTTAGVYVGIGITVQKQDDNSILITSVTEGGSAEKAGIKAGDFLLEVEGINATEHYEEAVKAVAGEVDTYVSLRIKRGDTGIEQSLSVKRAHLDEITVHSKMLDNQIGYIRISKFRTVTAEQFETARKELLNEGAKGFIFDVRSNGGGVLSALEKMVDPILPEGELAFAYNKKGEATTILKSDKNEMIMPYLVLVNEGSASASELFACVLRDYAGAKLIGTKTFGKGIMQTTFDLSSGGVTLTTATYATGKTPCYHGVGLEPDILSELAEDATEDTQLADAEAEMNAMIAADAAA
ncbi:MAG: PDZ domain-containing protein [Oscillospiraceae bacterium]|nr:PDZ domain-containing protein [Oscillospiraceae bacterium]